MMDATGLIKVLEDAFGYTADNTRDLVTDETFSLADVVEELEVERSYRFLQAFIARNEKMINGNLEDE
jgi:hypothetical protein